MIVSAPTHLHRYPNGFELLLIPCHSAPVLALDLWVRVGSADEPVRQAGISHVVEHMLFKSTRRRAAGVMAREIEAVGGDINACTSFDHTTYSLVVASRHTDLALDVLADAVAGPCFDAQELELERQVIQEEILRSTDLPEQHLTQQVLHTAFSRHPYGRPIIGSAKSVQDIDAAACRSFWQHWYQPGNMVLVAAGALEPEAMIRRVGELFGTRAAGRELQRRARFREPQADRMRCFFTPRRVQEVYFELAFPGPAAAHPDTPVLDLLLTVLSHGEASRLQQRLKLEEHLVHGIEAGAYSPVDPGLVYLTGTTRPDAFATAFAALADELARLLREPVGRRELERTRQNLEADFIYQKETVEGLTQKAGFFHLYLGSADAEERYLQVITQTDAHQLQAVARKYFSGERAILGVVYPQQQPPPLALGQAREQLQQLSQTPTASRRRRRGQGDGVRQQVLDNGLRLLVRENHHVPLLAVRVAIRGGLCYEAAAHAGAFHVLSQSWVRGTSSHDALQLAQAFDAIGGHLDGFSGRNSFGLSGAFLSRYLEEGLELFCNVLNHPAFATKEVAMIRDDALAAMRLRDDDPCARAWHHFEQHLYGNHPFARDVLGQPDTLEQLTRRTVRDLYRHRRCPRHTVIAVAGDVAAEQVFDFFRRNLSPWSPCASPAPLPPPPARPSRRRTHHFTTPFNQAHLVYGYLGATLDDPRRHALRVANAMLCGQGGRLFRCLREDKGLAYAVDSLCVEGLSPGYLGAHAATAPAQVDTALAMIRDQYLSLARGAFDVSEVAEAQNKLVGSYEIALQENGFQASQLALEELLSGGSPSLSSYADDIFRVTAADVVRAAADTFTEDSDLAVVLAPSPSE